LNIERVKVALYRQLPILGLPGIRYAFRIDGFQNLLHFIYCRKINRHNTFMLLGESYHYFDTYKTWLGERVVEIPAVMKMVTKYQGMRILGIGNVLSHHVQFSHDILDKYEIINGVMNED
jgi:hypothetical protein